MRKSYRVKREKEFQKVFFKGKSSANRQFVVYVLPKSDQNHFRVGLSVGKKIGNAVVRNSVKRKVRQSIFELKDEMRQDCDFVVIARKGCQDLSFYEVKQNLVHVFKVAKLLEK